MIFWIVLAAVSIAIIYFTVDGWRWGDFTDGVFMLVMSAFWGAVALGLSILLTFVGLVVFGAHSTHSEERSTHQELRAVATGDQTSGAFFLGIGSFDGKRTVSYITERDGWAQLDQVDATKARIAEDATPDTTAMTTTTVDYYIWWAFPWNAWDKTTHYFHVPEGSIIENYNVSAK